MKLLIIDDDPDFTELLGHYLKQIENAASVSVCQSYEEAAQFLQTVQTPFDFLFLDHHLPGDDGADLLARLKENPALENAYAVMLTGDDRDQLRGKALAFGFHAFLPKPVNRGQLEKIVCERRIFWDLADLPRNMDDYWVHIGKKALVTC